MNPLTLIGSPLKPIIFWAVAGVLAVLLAALGVQTVRLASAQAATSAAETKLAKEQTARAEEAAQRAELYAADQRQQRRLQESHAAGQQETVDAYAKTVARLEHDRAADRVWIGDLQLAAEVFTSGRQREGETDAAAVQRLGAEIRAVGGLLKEGIGLVGEGRGIVEARDADISYLRGVLANDRALTEPKP